MDPDETLVTYDVTSLFTLIPIHEAVNTVETTCYRDALCPAEPTSLVLCLKTTCFHYRDSFDRQKNDCSMGSPMSPIVAKLL